MSESVEGVHARLRLLADRGACQTWLCVESPTTEFAPSGQPPHFLDRPTAQVSRTVHGPPETNRTG
jgi:hypothetical protein